MTPALRMLEVWTTHQDYLWFLALLAWGGVLGGEWRRKHEAAKAPPRPWLMVLAVSGMVGATLELVLLAQDLKWPYVRLDGAMGAVQAVGAAAIVWGATAAQRSAHLWRGIAVVALATAAFLRIWRQVEGGIVLCLVQGAALLLL